MKLQIEYYKSKKTSAKLISLIKEMKIKFKRSNKSENKNEKNKNKVMRKSK